MKDERKQPEMGYLLPPSLWGILTLPRKDGIRKWLPTCHRVDSTTRHLAQSEPVEGCTGPSRDALH